MDYKYNQYIFRKVHNRKKILAKFITYRPDKDTIVYEYENAVYQCPSIEIYPADYNEIYRHYASKMAALKRNMMWEKSIIRKNKQCCLDMMNKIQQSNKRIKEISIELFNNRLVNKVTNSDICSNDIANLLNERTQLQRDKKEFKCEYSRKHERKKYDLKELHSSKTVIESLKKERKEILESKYYIKNIEKYKNDQIKKFIKILEDINEK